MQNVLLFEDKQATKVVTDGGVCGKNPSDFGGSWAFAAVDENDELIFARSGFTQSPNGKTTNNHTEYLAVVMALEAMPSGWSGTVVSDSMITLGRIFYGWKNKNLPEEYIVRAKTALKRLGKVVPKHVDGHATQKQLAEGKGKRGNSVDKWNCFVDSLCTQEVNKVKGKL